MSKKIIFALLIGFIITLSISVYSKKVSTNLKQNIVRLHIVAHSNDEKDQNLKLLVRDRIIEEMAPIFDNCESIEETKLKIKENLGYIQRISNEVILENGFSYEAKAFYKTEKFPTKIYNDIALPKGEYESVIITIGDNKGENWWCVMYPPLCFIDSTLGSTSEKSKAYFKENLTKDEYDIIMSKSSKKVPVKIKFKLLELFN